MGMIYDRTTKTEYEDLQYGGKYLHFLYHNVIGRIFLKIFILPFVSKLYGKYQNTKASAKKIESFVQKNHIDMSEYEEKEYQSFNDFFVRKKKQVFFDGDEKNFLAPADSKVMVYPITEDLKMNIKNSQYTLSDFLQNDEEIKQEFQNGYCVVFRLSVDDYHRYYFIDDGVEEKQYEIKGVLHTVSSFSEKEKIYAKNHRVCHYLDTKNFGKILYIEVGAMLVGKIHNYDVTHFQRGQEKGYFEYGGSTVVLITNRRIEFDQDIVNNSNRNVETKVKVRRKDR